MNMSITINAQVCLLLTVRFSQRDETEVLSPTQWEELCLALGGNSQIGILLEGSTVEILQHYNVNKDLQESLILLIKLN